MVWKRGKKTMDVDVKIKLGDEMGRDNIRISLENETSGGEVMMCFMFMSGVRRIVKGRKC